MTKFDKSKLPSRHTSIGPSSAPHRSYYYAMGVVYTKDWRYHVPTAESTLQVIQ